MRSNRLPATGLLFLSVAFAGVSVVSGACSDGGSGSSSSSSSTGGTASSTAQASSTTGATSAAGGTSAPGSSQGTATSSPTTASSLSFDAAGFFNPDGGLAFDANYQPHTGTPEDGVGCGTGVTCTGGTPSCCIGLAGAMCGAQCGFGLALACDGPEDCDSAGGQVCCFAVTGGGTCTASADCMGGTGLGEKSRLCNSSADCAEGAGCCRSGYLMAYDVGQCVVGCNVSMP